MTKSKNPTPKQIAERLRNYVEGVNRTLDMLEAQGFTVEFASCCEDIEWPLKVVSITKKLTEVIEL